MNRNHLSLADLFYLITLMDNMGKIKKFEYEGQTISFEFEDGNRMINATQMAKPFRKLVGNFLRLQSTKDYIAALQFRYSDVNNEKSREVLRVVQAGDAKLQGTWMDEKLALKFAAWLAIDFELWVYDRIHELLTTGKTELPVRPAHNIIKSLRLIADQLEAHDRDIQELKEDVGQIKDYVGDLEAKITSIDENYYSVSGYCALHAIHCPLNKARSWGYAATKLSNQTGKPIGKAYDAKYGNINTYHVDILKQVIQ